MRFILFSNLLMCWGLLTSCTKSTSSTLVDTATVEDVLLTMSYLSPEVLAKAEAEDMLSVDSLASIYANQLTFGLNIESTDLGKKITYRNIYSEKEYKVRMFQLDFELQPLFELKVGDQVFEATSSHFIRTPTQDDKVEILITLPMIPESLQGENQNITVIYYDDVFLTGIHHFNYSLKEILSYQTQILEI